VARRGVSAVRNRPHLKFTSDFQFYWAGSANLAPSNIKAEKSGQSVCSVARRYRLRASQLFAWRKSARLQRERRYGDSKLVPTAVNKRGDTQPSLASQAGPGEIATGRGAEATQKGAAAGTLKEVLRSLSDNT
jgi:transposase-like protein